MHKFVWMFLAIVEIKKNRAILHFGVYQNYQMNLSDICQIWGRKVMFMHVKESILLRNIKAIKYHYRFPKDEPKREKWIKSIPNANLVSSKYVAVCASHWASRFEEVKVKVNGKSISYICMYVYMHIYIYIYICMYIE